jgi:hypothetical protein
MSMVGFPLLLIPLAIYNIVVFLMPGVSLTDPLFKLQLISGAEWAITLSDMLLALGVLMLLLEVVKGARPGAKYFMDHLLSLVVFGGAAAEFVLWPKFGNSTYFLLALLSLADFLSGISLRIRRSVQYALVPVSSPRDKKKRAEAPSPADQRIEPAPAVPANETRPSAASVAESVLLDRPDPRVAQPAAPARPPSPSGESSPQVASPDLQPSSNGPQAPDTTQR